MKTKVIVGKNHRGLTHWGNVHFSCDSYATLKPTHISLIELTI